MSLLSVPLKTILAFHADLQNEAAPVSYAFCDGTLLTSGQQDINPGSTYQLPDLRNAFLLGADVTKAASTTGGTTNSSSDAPGPKGSGGSHSVGLITNNLPSHTHTASSDSQGLHVHSGSTAANAGSHNHTGATGTESASHTHSGTTGTESASHSHNTPAIATGPGSGLTNVVQDSGGSTDHNITTGTESASHTHSFTSGVENSNHTHSIASDGTHNHTLTIVSDGAHTHTITVANTGSGTAFDIRPRYYGVVYIMKVKL